MPSWSGGCRGCGASSARSGSGRRTSGSGSPAGGRGGTCTSRCRGAAAISKSRNYLLSRALDDEDWVLWLDVDVVEYPPDVIERLLAAGRDIVHPNCVKEYGGEASTSNAWRDQGRHHLHDLRSEGDLVRLHAVGGTMLLVRADLHREGLVFPPFLYGLRNPLIRPEHDFFSRRNWWSKPNPRYVGEIDTEGFGMMAHDMGYECWGMPNLEIKHKDA